MQNAKNIYFVGRYTSYFSIIVGANTVCPYGVNFLNELIKCEQIQIEEIKMRSGRPSPSLGDRGRCHGVTDEVFFRLINLIRKLTYKEI